MEKIPDQYIDGDHLNLSSARLYIERAVAVIFIPENQTVIYNGQKLTSEHVLLARPSTRIVYSFISIDSFESGFNRLVINPRKFTENKVVSYSVEGTIRLEFKNFKDLYTEVVEQEDRLVVNALNGVIKAVMKKNEKPRSDYQQIKPNQTNHIYRGNQTVRARRIKNHFLLRRGDGLYHYSGGDWLVELIGNTSHASCKVGMSNPMFRQNYEIFRPEGSRKKIRRMIKFFPFLYAGHRTDQVSHTAT